MNSLSAPSVEQGFIYLRSPFAGSTELPAQRYARIRSATLALLSSDDPKHRTLVERENQALFKLKEIGTSQVQDNRFLSNLSVQYKNDEYIGEMLMPTVQAPNLAGEYPRYDKRSRLAAPDDSMAGRTTANEIQDNRLTPGTFTCKPYALANHVDVLTLRNQVAPLDEMVDLTESVAELMALRREIRIAAKLTDASNYASANKITLSAGSRWDEQGGNPVKIIQGAVAALWNGRGPSKILGWCSLDVWNVLSRNPMILDLFKYGGTAPGLATPAMIAGFFGLDGLLVSKARKDTANEGQTASYSRIWGNYFGVTRVADRATIRNAGWGATFRFGSVLTRVWFDPRISTEGGYYSQVSTHEDHNIQAADTGYLVTTPITP
jgi:hypothetical protein